MNRLKALQAPCQAIYREVQIFTRKVIVGNFSLDSLIFLLLLKFLNQQVLSCIKFLSQTNLSDIINVNDSHLLVVKLFVY